MDWQYSQADQRIYPQGIKISWTYWCANALIGGRAEKWASRQPITMDDFVRYMSGPWRVGLQNTSPGLALIHSMLQGKYYQAPNERTLPRDYWEPSRSWRESIKKFTELVHRHQATLSSSREQRVFSNFDRLCGNQGIRTTLAGQLDLYRDKMVSGLVPMVREPERDPVDVYRFILQDRLLRSSSFQDLVKNLEPSGFGGWIQAPFWFLLHRFGKETLKSLLGQWWGALWGFKIPAVHAPMIVPRVYLPQPLKQYLIHRNLNQEVLVCKPILAGIARGNKSATTTAMVRHGGKIGSIQLAEIVDDCRCHDCGGGLFDQIVGFLFGNVISIFTGGIFGGLFSFLGKAGVVGQLAGKIIKRRIDETIIGHLLSTGETTQGRTRKQEWQLALQERDAELKDFQALNYYYTGIKRELDKLKKLKQCGYVVDDKQLAYLEKEVPRVAEQFTAQANLIVEMDRALAEANERYNLGFAFNPTSLATVMEPFITADKQWREKELPLVCNRAPAGVVRRPISPMAKWALVGLIAVLLVRRRMMDDADID